MILAAKKVLPESFVMTSLMRCTGRLQTVYVGCLNKRSKCILLLRMLVVWQMLASA